MGHIARPVTRKENAVSVIVLSALMVIRNALVRDVSIMAGVRRAVMAPFMTALRSSVKVVGRTVPAAIELVPVSTANKLSVWLRTSNALVAA